MSVKVIVQIKMDSKTINVWKECANEEKAKAEYRKLKKVCNNSGAVVLSVKFNGRDYVE